MAAAFCLCAVLWDNLPSEGGTLRLRERSVVSGSLIRLKDVARILEPEEERRRQLEEIVLGPAPAPGRTIKLDFSEIRSRLQAMGVDLSRIRFSGRSQVLITRSEKTDPVKRAAFSSESSLRRAERQREQAERILSAAVQRHLKRAMPQADQVSVSVRLRPEDIPLILAAGSVLPDIRGLTQPLQRLQLLKADFHRIDGKTVTVPFECRILPKPFVLAAKYTIARGDLIQAADLTWKQVSSAEAGFTDPEMVIGREAKRTIARGNVLTRADIQQVPLIRPNDIVTVYSRRPGITIKREMKARTGGALGETVTLVELKGRQSVTARVIGLHKAEVLSGGISLQTAPPSETGGIVFRRLSRTGPLRPGLSQGEPSHPALSRDGLSHSADQRFGSAPSRTAQQTTFDWPNDLRTDRTARSHYRPDNGRPINTDFSQRNRTGPAQKNRLLTVPAVSVPTGSVPAVSVPAGSIPAGKK